MSERSRLIQRLDKLVSKIVIERDKKCVLCGKISSLTCGHLFSRTHYSTRWDLANCNCQCVGCNLRHEFDWEPYRRWFVANYGESIYEDLYEKHRQTKKWKGYELEELYEQLKQKLNSGII